LWSDVREQHCWVHKTANVLDKLPKSVQPKAKEMLQAIYLAAGRAEAEKAFDLLVRSYEAKYAKHLLTIPLVLAGVALLGDRAAVDLGGGVPLLARGCLIGDDNLVHEGSKRTKQGSQPQ
jgi:hypothetical protein